MVNREVLEKIGLSRNESEIYLILLQIGESTIYNISDYSKISRPNIYDIIKKLQVRGLVSSIIKKSKKYFKASKPENLLYILKDNETNLLNILPKLNTLYNSKDSPPTIEVFQGSQGLKIIMNDMLKAKEILVFNGVDMKEVLDQIHGFHLEKYLDEKKKKKIKTKILYSQDIKPIKGPNYEYKKIPKNSPGCVNYWTYNDRVVIAIWSKELLFIRIIDVNVAKTYKESINLIWKSIK